MPSVLWVPPAMALTPPAGFKRNVRRTRTAWTDSQTSHTPA